MKKHNRISVSMPLEFFNIIKSYCDKEDRTLSGFLRQAAKEKLERIDNDIRS